MVSGTKVIACWLQGRKTMAELGNKTKILTSWMIERRAQWKSVRAEGTSV